MTRERQGDNKAIWGRTLFGIFIHHTYDNNGNALTETFDASFVDEYSKAFTYNKLQAPRAIWGRTLFGIFIIKDKQTGILPKRFKTMYQKMYVPKWSFMNNGYYGEDTYINQYSYTYDNLGNRTSETETANGTSVTESYTYDAESRVTSTTKGEYTTDYAYDANGNLTFKDSVD